MPHPPVSNALKSLACLLWTLPLAACVTSNGLAPELALLDADRLHAEHLSADAASQGEFPAHDWWRGFGDAQLDALMEEALRDAPSLALADARLRAARAQAGLMDANRRPGVNVGARYSGLQLPASLAGDELGGSVRGTAVATLDAAWSPDVWGAQRAQWQAAVGQARASQADAQAARLLLSGEIARLYFALAEAFAVHDITSQERARAEHLAGLARQRVEAGLDNALQLHNADTAIGSARQQIQAAAQQIESLRLALAALLGKGPDRGLQIAPPQILRTPAPVVPAVLPSTLIGQRPDVVAARWRVEAAARHIDVAQAAFRPNINLSALIGVAAPTLSDLFNADALFTLSGPALNLPLFDGGRRRATLAGRHAEYDLAVADYNQRLVTALQQIADALSNARALDAQIDSVRDTLRPAQAAFTLASQRYEGGIGTQLDVLAAQRPLLELEQLAARLNARRLNAAVALTQALGGGLPLDAALPSSAPLAATPSP